MKRPYAESQTQRLTPAAFTQPIAQHYTSPIFCPRPSIPRMTRLTQHALYLLLVLMQTIAPWVHAHTGTETGGILHLPGLEFFSGPHPQASAAEGRIAMQQDFIVFMQAGYQNGGTHATPHPPDGLAPASFAGFEPPPSIPSHTSPRASTAKPCRLFFPDAIPRAPPAVILPA